jgi:hypothetical protein
VRIARLIGFLMVNAMCGNPEDRSAFKGQGTANGKEVFHPHGAFVAAMRVETMVANADPEADGHPVEDQCGEEDFPRKHEKGGDRAGMENDQRDSGNPVQLVADREDSLHFSRTGFNHASSSYQGLKPPCVRLLSQNL